MHLAELATQQRLICVVAATFHIRVRVVTALAGGASRPRCDLGGHSALQLRRRCGLWTPQALTVASETNGGRMTARVCTPLHPDLQAEKASGVTGVVRQHTCEDTFRRTRPGCCRKDAPYMHVEPMLGNVYVNATPIPAG